MRQTVLWYWWQTFNTTINLNAYTQIFLIAYNILRKWSMRFETLRKAKFEINDVEIILSLLSINNWCFMINISWIYCYEFEKTLFRTLVSISNRRLCNLLCIYFNFCIAFINSHDRTFLHVVTISCNTKFWISRTYFWHDSTRSWIFITS